MNTFYLVCFVLGLIFSLLAVFGGLGRLHVGHFHLGHIGHAQAVSTASHRAGASAGGAFNGFTLAAFLCWFGGVGYLLHNFTGLTMPVVLLFAIISGVIAAGLIYALLFKALLPRERVLSPEDTRMEGVVAQVSGTIRAGGGVGEVLFVQNGARRSAPARSESGGLLERGTEVVVLRFERGIASVSPLPELSELGLQTGPGEFSRRADPDHFSG